MTIVGKTLVVVGVTGVTLIGIEIMKKKGHPVPHWVAPLIRNGAACGVVLNILNWLSKLFM
ncbi:hypothetical protein [Ectobacillus antri]|uniref:hypothetical protein n=1 Tax=Ectobacillus antri TaxID=2486280 RepID=UPI000F59404D|nr:hypothetical protein [Ectobacillus antri]